LKKEFVKLYGSILRVRNILTTFDEFGGKEILTERDVQDYHSMYIDLYNEFRKGNDAEKETINDDLVFEMELIKQVEITIDYILELIKKYHRDHAKNKDILVDIKRAIESSVDLRNKKDLIEKFIASLNQSSSIEADWIDFVEKKKKEELDTIIKDENLNPDETFKFIQNAFRDGAVTTTGTSITKILPPVTRFSSDGQRTQKKENVLKKLIEFFERFFGISKKER
jgi:type I restriction enzyme R subunit